MLSLFFIQKEKTARSFDTVLVVLKSMRGEYNNIIISVFSQICN